MLPPGHTDPAPSGYHLGHSASIKNLLAVRSLPTGGDVRGALEALRRIKVYPLASADSLRLLNFVDTSERRMDSTCLRWEEDLQFWEVLHRVLDAEPLVEKFLPMYGLLADFRIYGPEQAAFDRSWKPGDFESVG